MGRNSSFSLLSSWVDGALVPSRLCKGDEVGIVTVQHNGHGSAPFVSSAEEQNSIFQHGAFLAEIVQETSRLGFVVSSFSSWSNQFFLLPERRISAAQISTLLSFFLSQVLTPNIGEEFVKET